MGVERKPLPSASDLNTLAVEQTWHFSGELSDVTEARESAAVFLGALRRMQPPSSPDAHDDVLLVVTELASNAFAYAPGPFGLRLRAMADTVQIAMTDTSPTAPKPRPADLSGRGGIGWHLINAVAEQTITVPEDAGKTVHAFLPW
ncbi:ATP-binding protein (plasmid) [Streptomyces sp. CA-294286]|uniref:ATP-binding protein n=1 Tax=Streptomyces sp. CA-294286 TaxID=3240070 RepID=UPI003D8C75C1